MIPVRARLRGLALILATVFLIDQLSKQLAVAAGLPVLRNPHTFPWWFPLAGLFLAVTLVVVVPRRSAFIAIGVGVGGALANEIDRMVLPGRPVVDFIPEFWHHGWMFNLADVFIVTGGIAIVYVMARFCWDTSRDTVREPSHVSGPVLSRDAVQTDVQAAAESREQRRAQRAMNRQSLQPAGEQAGP